MPELIEYPDIEDDEKLVNLDGHDLIAKIDALCISLNNSMSATRFVPHPKEAAAWLGYAKWVQEVLIAKNGDEPPEEVFLPNYHNFAHAVPPEPELFYRQSPSVMAVIKDCIAFRTQIIRGPGAEKVNAWPKQEGEGLRGIMQRIVDALQEMADGKVPDLPRGEEQGPVPAPQRS